MANSDLNSISFLVDFIKTNSTFVVSIKSLNESVQCALDEFKCNEPDLEIRIYSKELVSWPTKDKTLNWENKFAINQLRNFKSWFQNMLITFYKKYELVGFSHGRKTAIGFQRHIYCSSHYPSLRGITKDISRF